MQELRRFFIALGYFTRVPIPAWVGWAPDELNRAARYFPLVGLVVGAVGSAVLFAGASVLPAPVAVVLSMLSTVLMTGAFHEDGLADSADGFGGGWEKERVLVIMKDSRIGTFGAIALLLALLLKFQTLTALAAFDMTRALIALPLAHAASRAGALMIMVSMRYVREDDSARAKPVAQQLGRSEWIPGLLFGALPCTALVAYGLLDTATAVAALSAIAISTFVSARYFERRIGGYTGDCLGAAQQANELVCYLALCIPLPH